MRPIACLSADFDLKGTFEHTFSTILPDWPLKRPDEVANPEAVLFAFAQAPAPRAFDAHPNLSAVFSWCAGVDRLVDHPGLRPEIMLCRMVDPGQADMIAAFAAHFVTGWHRGMFRYPSQQTRKIWSQVNWTANADFQVGLLGFGRMGAAIGRALIALGYPVSAWESRVRSEDGVTVLSGRAGLEQILGAASVVINVLPLTPLTRGILNH